MILKLTQIQYEDQLFKFNREMEFEVVKQSHPNFPPHYLIINEELNASVWAESQEKALEALAFWFYAIHLNYYPEDDSNLTEKAKELKKKLKGLYTVE